MSDPRTPEQVERDDGWRYLLDNLRGNIRGRDETLIRYLEDARMAAQDMVVRDADRFKQKVIIERLEMSLMILRSDP